MNSLLVLMSPEAYTLAAALECLMTMKNYIFDFKLRKLIINIKNVVSMLP